eukprot:PhF_6_TR22580/c0_g1_i1/m.32181
MTISFLFVVAIVVHLGTVTSVDPCTENDRQYAFTPCNPLTQSRTSITYYSRSCNATGLNTQLYLPRPAPCVMECPSGTYYSPKTIDCEQCPIGTYSSTGDAVDTYDSLPTSFVTYCTRQPCESWQPGPYATYFHSGNQSVGTRLDNDDSTSSVLTFVVNVVQPAGGSVSFNYLVESEANFDGLTVSLNGTRQQFNPLSKFLGTGLMRSWTYLSIPLPYGGTEVTLAFEKDADVRTTLQAAFGSDRAYIRDIVFEGTKMYVLKCQSCPAGTYTNNGRTACLPCAANTYSDVGAKKCTACPDNTFAGERSSSCTQKIPCNAFTDYAPTFTKCDKSTGKRDKSYVKLNPYCTETSVTLPPKELYVDCAACPAGTTQNNFQCIQCEDGTARDNSALACKSCFQGTAAVKSLVFTDFDMLDGDPQNFGYFDTYCIGLCKGCTTSCTNRLGWEVLGLREAGGGNTPIMVLHSGAGRGIHADSILTMMSNVVSPGAIRFKYFFYRRPSPFASSLPDDVSGSFIVNDNIEYKLSAENFGIDHTGYFEIPLAVGVYKFAWIFHKNMVQDSTSPISLALRNLEVVGDSRGGASRCQDCLPGYTCGNKTAIMKPCPAGTFQNLSRSTACIPCPPGTVSGPGSTKCRTCTGSTFPNENQTDCYSTCMFSTDQYTYDLTLLRSIMYGPIGLQTSTFDLTQTALADSKGLYRFFMKVCEPLGSMAQQVCPGTPDSSYICLRLTRNVTTNLGSDIRFTSNKEKGLTLSYVNGGLCGSLTANEDNRYHSSSLRLECDKDRSNTQGILKEIVQTGCGYNFNLLTPYACPVCTRESYMNRTTECFKNGTYLVKFYKKSEMESCYGGTSLPDPIALPCNRCTRNMYEIIWSACSNHNQYQTFHLLSNYTMCYEDAESHPEPESRYCIPENNFYGGTKGTLTVIILIVLSLVVMQGCYLGISRSLRLKRAKKEEAQKLMTEEMKSKP